MCLLTPTCQPWYLYMQDNATRKFRDDWQVCLQYANILIVPNCTQVVIKDELSGLSMREVVIRKMEVATGIPTKHKLRIGMQCSWCLCVYIIILHRKLNGMYPTIKFIPALVNEG